MLGAPARVIHHDQSKIGEGTQENNIKKRDKKNEDGKCLSILVFQLPVDQVEEHESGNDGSVKSRKQRDTDAEQLKNEL
jgi:hypothetical protein